METYVVNRKNFIDIEDICRVEYKIENNDTEIVIKDIYFNQGGDVNENINPIFDLMNCLLSNV